jgi:multiple antibiotic resistance protein
MTGANDFLVSIGVALIALLPIVNPLGTAVLLLSISTHLTREERNRQITRACLYMAGILLLFLLAGHLIMELFGISIPGIRIAGGMVIGFLGFKMLFPDEEPIAPSNRQEAQQKEDISFTPLAMPSLAGPGAIAVVITMSSAITGRHGIDKVFAYAGVVLAVLLTVGVSWIVLRGAEPLRRVLGVNGVSGLGRIMGFLLVCIGTQFVINGARDLWLDTAFWQALAKVSCSYSFHFPFSNPVTTVFSIS